MTTYSYEEVVAKSTAYFKGDSLAATVFANKYALKDDSGSYLEATPQDMHRRLAKEYARIEAKYPNPMSEAEIFAYLDGFRYIVPQGSPMAGIGNNFKTVSLSNCFVIDPPADSYGGIMRTDEQMVQLMKRRGGVGFDLSNLRPKGTVVNNSAGTSTGIVPYMERYSNSTREVAQDGRRGALMLSIDIDHPDVHDFITAKRNRTAVTGANVSVRVTDQFMENLLASKAHQHLWPRTNPQVTKDIDTKETWDLLMESAWESAEPGILFWDKIKRESPADQYADQGFESMGVNPCAELVLAGKGDSCRLTAVNLYSFVRNPFSEAAYFDESSFEVIVGKAMRLMDNLVDLEIEKIDAILHKISKDVHADPGDAVRERNLWLSARQQAVNGRRTGLGITAAGDMIAALGLKYGTPEATEMLTKVMSLFAKFAYQSSIVLAEERGAFPLYDRKREESMLNPFLERLDVIGKPRRNISILTIAPTGSVSIMTQTTSGIEPVFMVAYKRRRKVNPSDPSAVVSFVDEVGDSWEEYQVIHPKFLTYLQQVHNLSAEQAERLTDAEIARYIEQSPYHGATANEIDPLEKVRMQGAVQRWIDHAISVTVNLPSDVSVDTVSDIYKLAWEVGCKGMTIYRDGSRSGVLVSSDDDGKQKEGLRDNHAPTRPEALTAQIQVVKIMDEEDSALTQSLVVFGLMDGRPYEVFLARRHRCVSPIMQFMEDYPDAVFEVVKQPGDFSSHYVLVGKSGDEVRQFGDISQCTSERYFQYGKLISSMLRHGMPLQFVAQVLRKPLGIGGNTLYAFQTRLAKAIESFIQDGTKASGACQECGSDNVVYSEGCMVCQDCGSSKCG